MALMVEVENLSVQHAGQWVLRDLCLQVSRGEKVALTGPSGSGKSTLLKCLVGLVRPDAGCIRICGELMDSSSVWQLRRHVAYVAQEPDLGQGNVEQVLNKPFCYRANASLRANLQLVPELMQRLNLPQSLLAKQVSQLSGGEKQRIAFISAILLERPILLLDEASSALDSVNKQVMADYIKQAEDLTVVAASHDAEWMQFATRMAEISSLGECQLSHRETQQ